MKPKVDNLLFKMDEAWARLTEKATLLKVFLGNATIKEIITKYDNLKEDIKIAETMYKDAAKDYHTNFTGIPVTHTDRLSLRATRGVNVKKMYEMCPDIVVAEIDKFELTLGMWDKLAQIHPTLYEIKDSVVQVCRENIVVKDTQIKKIMDESR